MEPKDDDLATRMRAAIDEADAERSATRQAAAAEAIDDGAARMELFDRLREFADRIGVIEAISDDDTLIFVYGDRRVRFSADGAGVIVTPEGWPGAETSRAWPEAALSGRWVLEFRRHARDEQMPLFERGLEEILVHGLGMPRPEAVDRPMSPRTARAMLAPAAAEPVEEAPRAKAARAPGEPKDPKGAGEPPTKRKRSL